MSLTSVSVLKVLKGRQDKQMYQETLETHLLSFLAKLKQEWGGEEPVFQQDGASIHTATMVKTWLADQGVATMEWPAKSPDLSPIENLWGDLALAVYQGGRQFEDKEALERQIMKSWASIEQERLQTLMDSMPGRLADVLVRQGRKIDK